MREEVFDECHACRRSQHILWLYFLTDSFASRWDAR